MVFGFRGVSTYDVRERGLGLGSGGARCLQRPCKFAGRPTGAQSPRPLATPPSGGCALYIVHDRVRGSAGVQSFGMPLLRQHRRAVARGSE